MSEQRQRPLKLLASLSQRALAEDLAREVGVTLEPLEITAFADGETRVHIAADVRGVEVFLLQSTCPPVNENLMTLALLIDAARAAGAARVVGLVPYLGYARQELRSQVGDPRSAQVVARLLAAVGLDHLVTLDLHAPALESAFPMPATLLRAEELFLPLIRSWQLKDLVLVGPDAGGLKRAQRFARALGTRVVVIAKDRPRPDQAEVLQVLGEVRGGACVIVDDMASTGRTLAGAAEALQQAGAREVHALFTHAVMAPGALERLLAAPLGRIVTSDSIPASLPARVEVV
jgi:ribose-phosphate pyrophosphokinase